MRGFLSTARVPLSAAQIPAASPPPLVWVRLFPPEFGPCGPWSPPRPGAAPSRRPSLGVLGRPWGGRRWFGRRLRSGPDVVHIGVEPGVLHRCRYDGAAPVSYGAGSCHACHPASARDL